MANKRLVWISLFTLLFFITPLAGCSKADEFQDLQDFMTKLKQAKKYKPKPSTIGDLKLPLITLYQGSALRSPFEDIDTINDSTKAATSPLISYPLNMLRLVGTLSANDAVTAYVLTPDNLLFEVNPGDMIGNNHGKVLSITPDEMKVLDLDPESQNQRIVVMQLKDDR